MCIDWDGFVTEARKAGWKDKKIQETILHACIDSNYGKDYLYKTFEMRKI